MYFAWSMVCMVVGAIVVLVAVAYLIVLERKLLGKVQLRLGPSKLSVKGVLQPFADGVKLFLKQGMAPSYSNKCLFFIAPVFMVSIMSSLWPVFPSLFSPFSFPYSVLYFMCVSSMNVYAIMMAGWSSNCKYGLMGAVRGAAQSISYEVVFSLVVYGAVLLSSCFKLEYFLKTKHFNLLISPELSFIWLIVSLAEMNRAPFDFVEGESELVSGFSVEYGGGKFAFIALGEYGGVLFMGVVTGCLFLSPAFISDEWSIMMVPLFSCLFCCFVILVRGSFPRYRYDKLMKFCWSELLPVCLGGFSFLISVCP